MTLLLNFMYVDNYIWIWWMLNGIWSLWNDSMGAMIKSSGWVKMSPFGIFPLILWFLDIFVWTYETLVHSIFRYCTVLQTLYICVYIYGTNGQSSCWWTFRLLPIYHHYKCCCCEHFCTCLLMKEFLWGASAVQQVMIRWSCILYCQSVSWIYTPASSRHIHLQPPKRVALSDLNISAHLMDVKCEVTGWCRATVETCCLDCPSRKKERSQITVSSHSLKTGRSIPCRPCSSRGVPSQWQSTAVGLGAGHFHSMRNSLNKQSLLCGSHCVGWDFVRYVLQSEAFSVQFCFPDVHWSEGFSCPILLPPSFTGITPNTLLIFHLHLRNCIMENSNWYLDGVDQSSSFYWIKWLEFISQLYVLTPLDIGQVIYFPTPQLPHL